MTDTTERLVVCGYDGSETAKAALAHAIDATGDGHLVVVHVHPAAPAADPFGYGALVADVRPAAEALMAGLADAEPRLAEVGWEAVLVAGAPAVELTRIAAERHADRIVIGSRGVGYLHALLGSVAYETIHLASCPVTVVPARALVEQPA